MSGPSEKDEEKRSVSAEAQSVESFSDADEALKLVGQERKEFFTEEYNARLRRKLVCISPMNFRISLNIAHVGHDYCPVMCCRIFYTVHGQNCA